MSCEEIIADFGGKQKLQRDRALMRFKRLLEAPQQAAASGGGDGVGESDGAIEKCKAVFLAALENKASGWEEKEGALRCGILILSFMSTGTVKGDEDVGRVGKEGREGGEGGEGGGDGGAAATAAATAAAATQSSATAAAAHGPFVSAFEALVCNATLLDDEESRVRSAVADALGALTKVKGTKSNFHFLKKILNLFPFFFCLFFF